MDGGNGRRGTKLLAFIASIIHARFADDESHEEEGRELPRPRIDHILEIPSELPSTKPDDSKENNEN